jgi:hypothetical protein
MKTLSICLKNQSPIEIRLTNDQYYTMIAQIKSSALDKSTGKIIVRSVVVDDGESYYETGRMIHPSDKR